MDNEELEPIDFSFTRDERVEMEFKALGYSLDNINYMYSDNITLSDERGEDFDNG